VQAATEDKMNDMKYSFYEELKQVYDQFLKHQMKILLGQFIAKVGRQDISKQQLRTRVLMKLVVILELTNETLPHPKL
jgi:hypothetical protein